MKKIRNKIYLGLVFPCILLYGLVLLMGLHFVSRSTEEENIHNKQDNLENIARGMNDWFVFRMAEMVNLADIPLLKSSDADKIMDYLIAWKRRFSFNYEEIYHITTQDHWRNTQGESGELSPNFLQSYFEGDLYHPYYMGFDPFFRKEQSLLFALPIRENGISRGYLVGSIPKSRIAKVLKFFAFEDFDSFMLVDPQGMIVAHSEPEKQGQSEFGLYQEEFVTSKRYHKDYVFVRELRTSWKLVAFLSAKKVLAPIPAIRRLAYFSSLILFLFLAGLSYYFTYLLVSPIQIIKKSLLKIMHGDYSEKIHLSTQDECQQLAETINLLTEGMIKRRFDDRFLFLGHFAARMAHDMRHPLSLISLMTEDLQDNLPDYREKFSAILQEVDNTNKFIRGIIDFSKDDSVDLSPASLTELVRLSLAHMAPHFRKNEIAVDFIDQKNSKELYLDIPKMNQIITNVLQNAIESIAEGGDQKEKKILLSMEESKEYLHLDITDTGAGFDEKYRDQFFDPYFTTKESGSGLGLSICLRYLDLMNGKIELINTEDHQGRIRISLRK